MEKKILLMDVVLINKSIISMNSRISISSERTFQTPFSSGLAHPLLQMSALCNSLCSAFSTRPTLQCADTCGSTLPDRYSVIYLNVDRRAPLFYFFPLTICANGLLHFIACSAFTVLITLLLLKFWHFIWVKVEILKWKNTLIHVPDQSVTEAKVQKYWHQNILQAPKVKVHFMQNGFPGL